MEKFFAFTPLSASFKRTVSKVLMKRLLPLFFLVACAKGPVNAKIDPRDYYPQDIRLTLKPF